MRKTILGFVAILLLLTGCFAPPSDGTTTCFGIPCDFSGKLSEEQEKSVIPELRGSFCVESVRDITLTELVEALKHKDRLAEETRDGIRYVALRDYRCVNFGNGVSGMMIVVERYKIKGK